MSRVIGLLLCIAVSAPGCKDEPRDRSEDREERRERRKKKREKIRQNDAAYEALLALDMKQQLYFANFSQYVTAPPRSDFSSLECTQPSEAARGWCHLAFKRDTAGVTLSAHGWNKRLSGCSPEAKALSPELDCTKRWYVLTAETADRRWLKTSQMREIQETKK